MSMWASLKGMVESFVTWLGDWRLRGAAALVFVIVAFLLASGARWFLLGEFSVRLLFPSFLLAVFVTTWVVGTRAGVLGSALTLLTGAVVYSRDAAGLTERDLYSLAFVASICALGVLMVGKARRTRDRLSAGRRWYGALLDHSTEAIGFVTADGRLRYLNRSGRALWGIGDEAMGRPVSAVLPMQRLGEPFVLDTQPRVGHGPIDRRSLPLGVCAKHAGAWVEVTGCGTWIDDPEYGKGLVFSLQWDEALRHTVNELDVTRRHLEALLDADVVGVAAVGSDGHLRFANRALLDMIGVPESSGAASSLHLDEIMEGGPHALAGLDRAPRDTRLRRSDGETVWASLSLASTGPNEGLLLATRIDDRKRAEQDAHFGRILLQAIIDELPTVIAFVRPDGHAEIVNRYACELLASDLRGHPLDRNLPPELWARLAPALSAAWRGEESRLVVKLESHHAETRHLQTQLTPYRNDRGDIEGVVWHAIDVTERLHRERRLAQSEYRFRRLAEAFSAVVWQATDDGQLISEFGWQQYTGLDAGAFIRDWACAVHPDDQALLQAFEDGLAQGSERRDVELRLAFHAGGYRHVALKGIPLEDPGTSPRRWIGCIRDIHSRKVYAAALAARESELRLILETVPVRLAYLDTQNNFQWCNRSFSEWFGFRGDASGAPLATVLPQEVMLKLAGALDEAQRGGTSSLEWTYAHPEQGLRWTSTSFTPDLEPDGRVRGVITLCVDCTDRHEREVSLRRSVAEHQALVENVPHMVWIASPQGKVEYFNHRWYEFTLLCESRSWTDAIHPSERVQAEEAFKHARAAGTEFSLEVRCRRGVDSEYRWHLVRATPLRHDDGSIIRWYGTCTDIEDQKAAQETLREAQSRTDQFLATLSHELRNPLAALVSNAHLLDRYSAQDQRWQEASATIRRQSAHLKRLVDDLLDMSRITLGKVQVDSQLFDLGALCTDTCADFNEFASARGVDLSCDVPETPLWMQGDPARIRQCIDNLVSNAIKASHENGGVRITARLSGSEFRIVVEDQGMGIPKHRLRRIFQPFTQGEEWRHNGLGLGLAIVQKMVELHGGTVRAHSAGPGRGSRFTITLPHDPSLSAPLVRAVEAPSEAKPVKGKVLIVDDEQDSARALQYLLELEGHEVHSVADGETALALAPRIRPQVIVSDIGLPPPLDGLEIAARLRACADWPLYLVAYSGYGAGQDIARSLRGGFDSHLTKPCSPAALIAEVEKGLQACLTQTSEG